MSRLILVILLLIVFFVNFPALSDPCNWRMVCPDSIGTSVVAWHPNFYVPVVCGGIAGKCFPAHYDYQILLTDVVMAAIIILIFNKKYG